MEKAPEAFRTISEVANELDVPKHVLRFWEGKFAQLRPMKRGGGRRYYRPEDVELLRGVRRLLYEDGYTIKGVQKILREQGVRYVMDAHRADEDGLDARQARRQIPEVADDARRGVGARPHSQGGGGLSGQQRRQLDALLQELEACRKLLAAGRG